MKSRNWFFFILLLIQLVSSNQIRFDLHGTIDEYAENDLTSKYNKLANDSLLWGPYRSALYFGIRPRIPRSLLSGLMWFSADNYQSIGKIRHFYEQNDDMSKANWIEYDPRIGGRQIIKDNENHVDITIDFVKSHDGLSWGVKIDSKFHEGYKDKKIAFVWYSGLEGEKRSELDSDEKERTGFLKLENTKNNLGYEGDIKFVGISEELGAFELTINDGPDTNKHPKGNPDLNSELDPRKTHHYSLTVPDDNVWQARDIFMTMLQESIKELIERFGAVEKIPPENLFILRDLQNFEGNLHFIEKIYQGDCEFDIIYDNALTPQSQKINSKNLATKINDALKAFEEKFQLNFKINAPFDSLPKYTEFAKELLSGLLGGLSYVYGDHLVDRETIFDDDSFESYQLNGAFEGPHELFTLVPSRPFFPRGFYWDEGFHLMPLLQYDSDLVLDIIKSWFNLIDEDGWIAREQIIGRESRSRVPKEFQVQSPQIVNPPTLTLVLTYLLENVSKYSKYGNLNDPVNVDEQISVGNFVLNNPEVLTNYTREVYPKLKSHLNMFRRTQKGYVEEFDRGSNQEAYRWRGRTETHCLASGIDDYPRASPADVAELNVDLLSWIGIMTRSISLMAEILNKKEDVEEFKQIENDIIENINKLHWSEDEKTFCDVSVNEDDENIFVCHKGYVSLFPFLTKLISVDDNEKLQSIIEIISNPEELWSDYGVRSLSKQDPNYRTGENYWKSPIWININYLILDSIKYYYNEGKETMSNELAKVFAETYQQLRINIVKNVFDQWESTGFVWEQYNDEDGKAQKAKNFLGWTSTVLTMMTMPENID
ncbi:unnamed protein product [Candida verbasci]|uniref:Mannosyl-oligosaccharide glucosidase n=1 Tax=Candida verbasci TaxID=1227364 RepID=A0A9W4XHY4_9ASCO|nr:unnamed protein product [Candida verbasci]